MPETTEPAATLLAVLKTMAANYWDNQDKQRMAIFKEEIVDWFNKNKHHLFEAATKGERYCIVTDKLLLKEAISVYNLVDLIVELTEVNCAIKEQEYKYWWGWAYPTKRHHFTVSFGWGSSINFQGSVEDLLGGCIHRSVD